eukprot:CAMPEP_0197857596 /NCGR_PEP_ID=MMETSP1438-20131217/30806_1 /TAXON_ID=1461541 /ORGANISM="Pterosperma sp., Strain CCMP1384" /LENGTH=324 /DNA_ID=CAMNT_0043473481 /DNA_START=194 /DNA_END=1168 /DNA_ORIENTATION=+
MSSQLRPATSIRVSGNKPSKPRYNKSRQVVCSHSFVSDRVTRFSTTRSSGLALNRSRARQADVQAPGATPGHTHSHTGPTLIPLGEDEELEAFLDSLKYDNRGLIVAIVQDVDNGRILMQAFADRPAIKKTLTSGKASFYSRSRGGPWTKGETSGNFINVTQVSIDCDKDSLIYLGDPIGPSCHTGADTCYFTHLHDTDGLPNMADSPQAHAESALTTLNSLEATINQRKAEASDPNAKKSWTAKLLDDPELLCSKIREEANELCQTYELKEGKEATASEMADVLYHSMVLLAREEVPIKDVLKELRKRFGTSGIDEKASRKAK